MAGIRNLFNGIGLIILFGIALFTFMIGIISSNNPSSDILNNTLINTSLQSFQSSADQLQDVGESSKNLLTSYEPSPVFVFLIIYSAFAIPLNLLEFIIIGTVNIASFIFKVIFGIGSNNQFGIIMGVITGILGIAVVLAILRAIRGGDTER